MYQIFCDGYMLHDSRSDYLRVIEPVCDLELNKTGSLTFKIAKTHHHYDKIKKLSSEIELFEDGVKIFGGRVLNDEIDFQNFKNVVVEGDLAYLLDSIQRKNIYHLTGDDKVKDYLTDVINIHNNQVEDKKKFSVGDVKVKDDTDQFYKISNYEPTLTVLNEDLLKTFDKTYLMVRYENGNKYLDYLKSNDLPKNEKQTIQFGENLINMNKHIKGEEIATAIIPLGATEDSEQTDEGDTVDTKINISSLPSSEDGTIKHDAETDYIYDTEAVNLYGWIFKVINLDGVEEPENLLLKAKEQLKYYKQEAFNIELTAFDLHLLDITIQSIKLGDRIRVVSTPHGMNGKDYLIVEKMTIDIDNPANSSITLGNEERSAIKVNSTMSDKNNNTDNIINNVNKGLNDKPSYSDMDKYVDKYVSDSVDDYVDKYTPNKIKDYFDKNYNSGDSSNYLDLSNYATKTEVNSAFSELASLLGGL